MAFLNLVESFRQLMISLGCRKDSMFSMSSLISNTFSSGCGVSDWNLLVSGRPSERALCDYAVCQFCLQI